MAAPSSMDADLFHILGVLHQAFRFFDRDGNGHITVQEFQEVMMELGDDKLTKDECELFIQLIDKDGDEEV